MELEETLTAAGGPLGEGMHRPSSERRDACPPDRRCASFLVLSTCARDADTPLSPRIPLLSEAQFKKAGYFSESVRGK
jgi:hypothetical protein